LEGFPSERVPNVVSTGLTPLPPTGLTPLPPTTSATQRTGSLTPSLAKAETGGARGVSACVKAGKSCRFEIRGGIRS